MENKEKCLWCNGTGKDSQLTDYSIKYSSKKCFKCMGFKYIECEKNKHGNYERICPKCGHLPRSIYEWGKRNFYIECNLCNGTGLVTCIDEIMRGKNEKESA